MTKLVALFYVIVAPTLMGALVVVPLVVEELYTGRNIAIAALLGAVLALPASWKIADAIRGPARPARPA
jgi:hypothetical protein